MDFFEEKKFVRKKCTFRLAIRHKLFFGVVTQQTVTSILGEVWFRYGKGISRHRLVMV